MDDIENADSSHEMHKEPQLYAVTGEAGGYTLKRRDFLKAAGAAAAMAGAGAEQHALGSSKLQHPAGNRMLIAGGPAGGSLPKAHNSPVHAVSISTICTCNTISRSPVPISPQPPKPVSSQPPGPGGSYTISYWYPN
jgi:hypothetical protein